MAVQEKIRVEKKKRKARQAENLKGRSRQKLEQKKKKKRDPARLKTQKGSLGKNQGQKKKKTIKKFFHKKNESK